MADGVGVGQDHDPDSRRRYAHGGVVVAMVVAEMMASTIIFKALKTNLELGRLHALRCGRLEKLELRRLPVGQDGGALVRQGQRVKGLLLRRDVLGGLERLHVVAWCETGASVDVVVVGRWFRRRWTRLETAMGERRPRDPARGGTRTPVPSGKVLALPPLLPPLPILVAATATWRRPSASDRHRRRRRPLTRCLLTRARVTSTLR